MSKIKTQINLIKFSKRKLIKLIIALEESNNIRQEQCNIQNEQLETQCRQLKIQQEIADNQQKQIDTQQILIEKLESELKALNKDSSNSSKPPSSDNNKPKKNQSLRKKSGKKSGGQHGRTGVTRKQNNKPDEIISCRPEKCDYCGKDLSNKKGKIIAKRQEIDIPPIEPITTEYRQEIIKCSCGHCNKGVFPGHINSRMQFGVNIKDTKRRSSDFCLHSYIYKPALLMMNQQMNPQMMNQRMNNMNSQMNGGKSNMNPQMMNQQMNQEYRECRVETSQA